MLRLVVLCLVAACGRIGFDARVEVGDDVLPMCGPDVDLDIDPKNCGVCGHDCLGGECSAGRCGAVQLATGQGDLRQLVVDEAFIYYAVPGVLRRISKETRATEDVATYSGLGFRMTQTIDHVYFVTRDTGLVVRAVKKPNQGPARVIATGQGDVGGIASDDMAAYWNNYPTAGRMYSIQLDDSLAMPVELTPPLDNLTVIRLVDNTLYFIRATVGLFAMPRAGGTPTLIAPVGSWELAIEGDHVFLAGNNELEIVRVSISTGIVTPVTTAVGPWGIAIDDTHVYFANEGGNTIARAPRSGGPPEILADAIVPVGIAVDDKAVYWSTRSGVIGMRAK